MFHAATMAILFACGPSPDPGPESVLVGSWSIDSNGHPGEMVVESADGGQVRGTMFGHLIVGTFDPATGTIRLKRMLDAQDESGRQQYTGKLAEVEGSFPPRYTLGGTFVGLAGGSWGKPGVEYPWAAEATRPEPASKRRERLRADFSRLQGGWQVSGIFACMKKEIILPPETGLDRAGPAVLTFDGNRLLLDGKLAASLAFDVGPADLEERIGLQDFRLLVLTTPEGRGFVCSYRVDGDTVQIAYPHTTSCRRGSGHVAVLKRPKP